MVFRTPLASLVRRFWRDCGGNYSMMVALLLPVLTGFVGVGTEAGLWLYDQQTQQAATDAAAFSAATFYATKESGPPSSTDLSNAETQAFAIAANYGFTSTGCQAGSTTCTPTCTGSGTASSCNFPANCTTTNPGTASFCLQVNFWPKTGPYAPGNNTGSLDAFEVKLAQSPQQLFSKVLMGNNPVIIQARSVGVINTAAGSGTSSTTTTTMTTPCNSTSCVCIKVTSISNAANSTGLSGSSTINLNGCSLEVDDPNSSALEPCPAVLQSRPAMSISRTRAKPSPNPVPPLCRAPCKRCRRRPATSRARPEAAPRSRRSSSTTNIYVGMTVTDTSAGIPSGTTVTAISGTTLTLSACATKTVTADSLSFTFTDPYSAQEVGNLYTSGPVAIPTITSSSLGGCATATSDSSNLTTSVTGSSSASYPTNSRFFTSVTLGGSTAFTAQPGVYYICPGGSFAISSSASLSAAPFAAGGSLTEGGTACTSPYLACKGVVPYQNGDGVTFVLLGLTNTTTGAVTNCASFAASGSAALNLVPPNSGPFSGILITSSPNCTAPAFGTGSGAESLSISGSATQNLFGAINLPQYAVNYSGSSAAASGGCLNLIANSLRISGSAGFGNNCTGVGTTGVGPATTTTTTTTTTTSGASTYSASLGN